MSPLSTLALAAFFALGTLVSGTPAPIKADEADWKYSVGWDGTTLPSYEIGEPVDRGNSTSLQKRAVGGVYICENTNWGRQCGYAVQPINTCIQLGNDWRSKISSFGPDPCTSCTAYAWDNCARNTNTFTGTVWSFNYPGDASGGLGSQYPWNDRILSFSCTQTCSPAGPAN